MPEKIVRLLSALPSMPPLSKDLPLPEQAPLSWRQRLSDWLYHFVPTPIGINGRERLRVTAGIGMAVDGLASSSRLSMQLTAAGTNKHEKIHQWLEQEK